MAFGRVAAGWAAVLVVFLAWSALEHKAQSRPGPVGLHLRRDAGRLGIEAGVLALLAGLWFASLGSGSGWLVFLLVGLLLELPQALRIRAETSAPIQWTPLAGRVGRIVVAGVAAGLVMTR